MANFTNIIELADGLIERLGKTDTVKTASAEPQISSDLSKVLRKIARDLRNDTAMDDLTVAEAVKLATTGAQAQGAGATAVQGLPPPTLPGLSTGNLGMTAGGGGAMPEPKLGSLSPEALHALGFAGLGAATGAGGGALAAGEGNRLEGAATGALAGGALGAGAGGLQAGLARALLEDPQARERVLQAGRNPADLALTGMGTGLMGASTQMSDEPSSKIAAILRKTAATLRAEHTADQRSKIATAQHTVRAAAALHTLRT